VSVSGCLGCLPRPLPRVPSLRIEGTGTVSRVLLRAILPNSKADIRMGRSFSVFSDEEAIETVIRLPWMGVKDVTAIEQTTYNIGPRSGTKATQSYLIELFHRQSGHEPGRDASPHLNLSLLFRIETCDAEVGRL